MANTVSGFYQTLVAAANEASQALVGTTSYLDNVYVNYKPETGQVGQTVNVVIPAQTSSQVSDLGAGDFVINDVTETTTPIVFNKHPGTAYIIRDFEQFNSPQDIRETFLDSYIKGVAEYVNAQIAALITPTNFNSYTPPQSASYRVIDEPSIASAMGQLATGKIPVNDFENFFLTTHPYVYYKMAGSTFWSANSQVGYQLAGQIRQGAMLGQQYGAQVGLDQAQPGNVPTAVTGTVGATNGSAAVTGSGTSFSTQLAVGQWLVFSNDPTKTPYQILTITSNTALTLAANYAGTTATGLTANFEGYQNFLFHRHAIALAVRPLPKPDGRVVDFMYIPYKKLLIRVQLGYNQLKDGYVVTLDAGYGLKVIRPDHGIIVNS